MSGSADRRNMDQISTQPQQNDDSTRLPSETTEPAVVGTPTQQAATQPGSGSGSEEAGETSPANMVPFKEQVLGYAKKTRGTLLGNTETKEIGDKILGGQMTAKDAVSHKP